MILFNNNILVQSGKQNGIQESHFLDVTFRDRSDPDFPEFVSLTRYTVPGRYDTYHFDYTPSPSAGIGNRVRFFTDTSITLQEALRLVQRDLNKKGVVEMLVEAYNQQPFYSNLLCNQLLWRIARTTKSYKTLQEIISQRQKTSFDKVKARKGV